MTSVRGISIFTETGHLRWRVTPSNFRCRGPQAIATDRKVESLERIRRAVVFGAESSLVPQAISWGDGAPFLP
jgi:hypothetical protein